MTRYINRWTALLGWTALMAIVWALFVPKGLSATTFALLSLTGPLVMAAGRILWRSQRPALSVRQIRAALDSDANPPVGVRR